MKRASTLSLVAALLLLVAAACSSGSSPEASPSESEAPPTPTPAASVDLGSFDALPSFDEGAGELADVLPTEIGGIALTYESSSGVEGMGEITPEDQAFIDRLGIDPERVSFAFGTGGDFTSEDGFIVLSATRVPGVDTDTLRDEFVAVLTEQGEVAPVEQTVGGKSVHAFGSEEEGSLAYLYVNGDIVFTVVAFPTSLAEEALAALP